MTLDLQPTAGAPSGALGGSLSSLRYRTTVDDLFKRAVELWPEVPLVIEGSGSCSYRDMDSRIDAVATGLVALGVGPGDKVALWMSNIWEWLAVQFAVTRIGAVLVPINTRLRANDLAHVLSDSGARVIFLQGDSSEFSYVSVLTELFATEVSLPKLEHAVVARSDAAPEGRFLDWGTFLSDGESVPLPPRDASPDDLAYILYTSGSTALPKGVMLSHVCLNNAINLAGDYVEGDCIFLGYPLFAVTGCQNSVLTAIVVGGSLVIQERFEPNEAVELIEKHKCTVIACITPVLQSIASAKGFEPDKVASLRTGSIFPRRPEHTDLLKQFGFENVTTGYGMTETSGPVTNSSSFEEIGVEGREWPGDQIKLVTDDGGTPETGQPGAIYVNTPHIMLGYLNNPEATAAQFDEDGWFITGDVGCRDEEGNLKWLGRTFEIIKSSGFNFAAQEVESFLSEQPEINEVAVIGVPDEKSGEVGIAYVTLQDGASFGNADLKRICSGRVASYKIPKEVIVVDKFTKTASGKIRKVDLNRMYKERTQQSNAG
ncbi:MAG: class I adenylate-forming enzyme family protein [Silicimonas sp.]